MQWLIPLNRFEIDFFLPQSAASEMETGQVDRHRSGRPAGRVAGRFDNLRPAGQAG